MTKKFIVAVVIILALSMLFVACKPKEEPAPSETQPSETEITTNVDEKGAYVFNKNNEKVYLVDDQGFIRTPEEAYNSTPSVTEDGFYLNGATDGEKTPSLGWDEMN